MILPAGRKVSRERFGVPNPTTRAVHPRTTSEIRLIFGNLHSCHGGCGFARPPARIAFFRHLRRTPRAAGSESFILFAFFFPRSCPIPNMCAPDALRESPGERVPGTSRQITDGRQGDSRCRARRAASTPSPPQPAGEIRIRPGDTITPKIIF